MINAPVASGWSKTLESQSAKFIGSEGSIKGSVGLFHNLFGPNSLRLTAEVAACTGIIYAFLILLMRFLGRQVLSQLSALDLLIVMLLGSSVETSMIHGSTLLRCGLVSAAVLLALNKLLTEGILRSKRFKNLVGGGPTI